MDDQSVLGDIITTIAILVYGSVGYVVSWFSQNLGLIELLSVAGIVAAVLYLNVKFRTYLRRLRTKKRGNMMLRDERHDYVQSVVSDMITEGFLQLELEGKLTRHEVNKFYSKFSRVIRDLKDIRPVSRHPAAIAKRVHENIAAMKDGKTPAIPGPKPGEGFPMSVIDGKKEDGITFKFLNRAA